MYFALTCSMHDKFPEQVCLANVQLCVWATGLLLVAHVVGNIHQEQVGCR